MIEDWEPRRTASASLMPFEKDEMLTALIVSFIVLVLALGSSLPANHDVRFFR